MMGKRMKGDVVLNNYLSKAYVKKLVGKNIVALKKDGTQVSGKLLSIKGNQLMLRPKKSNKATTKGILPLVLFDLLAIGQAGAYGYPGYGYSPYGAPYGYGYGYGRPFGYGYPGGFL